MNVKAPVGIRFYRSIAILFTWAGLCAFPGFAQEAAEIQRVERELLTAKGLARGQKLDQLGELLSIQQPTRALALVHEALRIAEQEHSPALEASVRHNAGVIYRALGRNDEASREVLQSLAMRRAAKDRQGEAQCLNTMGLIQIDLGNYSEAVEMFLAALAIRREVKSEPGIAYALNNIGKVYRLTGDYASAIRYIEQAIEIKKRLKLRTSLAYSYINLGGTYLAKGQLDEALKAFEHSLRIRNEVGDWRGLGDTYDALGTVHQRQGNIELALAEFGQAIELRNRVHDPNGTAETQIHMGRALTTAKRTDEARKALDSAIKLSEQLGSRSLLSEATLAMADLEQASGNPAAALRWYRQHMKEKREFLNETQLRRMAELHVRVEKQHEQQELELLRKEAALRNQQRGTERIVRNSLMVALLSALITGAVVVNRYRIKKRSEHLYRLKSEELAARSAELEALNHELERASQVKSAFLANVSHEIRTPLNGILGIASLLADTPLNSEQRALTKTILSSGENLLTIINDILDLSKIEAGKLELDCQEFNLRQTVEDVCSLSAVRAEEKGVELGLQFEASTPNAVLGDETRVRQILTNLVGNAVKFTDHGHVLVSVRGEPRQDGRVNVRMEVEDTGIGIPEKLLPKLFEKFQQMDNSSTRRHGGTGLGLAISRQLVELQGGQISVRTEENAGSTFSFELPFPLPATETVKAPALPDTPLAAVVWMEAPLAKRAVRGLCRENGIGAVDCGSAAEAAAHRQTLSAGKRTPVLITDVPSDQITASGLRHLARVQVVSRIASQTPEGAFVRRPVFRNALIQALAKALRPATTELPSTEPASVVSQPSARKGSILLVEDNAVNQRVALGLLKKLGFEVDIAGNGEAAIERCRSRQYDLVLMDCQMPLMDGFEATRRIRDLENGGHRAPIVALTASAMQGDRERCLSAGMDDHITKPISLAALQQVIAKYIEQEQRCPTTLA